MEPTNSVRLGEAGGAGAGEGLISANGEFCRWSLAGLASVCPSTILQRRQPRSLSEPRQCHTAGRSGDRAGVKIKRTEGIAFVELTRITCAGFRPESVE